MRSLAPLFFLVLAAFSCSRTTPEQVLENYFAAIKANDVESAYGLLSAADQAAKSLDQYKAEQDLDDEWTLLAKSFSDKVKRKVISVDEKEGKAIVKVDMEMPDVSIMMRDMLSSALQSAFGENELSSEEMLKRTLEKYKDKDIPMVKKAESYTLFRENGEWRVFLNWNKDQLVMEAKALEEQKDYPAALEKYQAALKTDQSNLEIKDAIQALETTLKLKRERESYLSQVEIFDVKARYFESILDGRIPGVVFKLRNNGNRPLSKVTVTVFFKDADDKVIFEEDYQPVDGDSYLSDFPVLKPGYIWAPKRDEFFTAERCPQEWKTGNVDIRVTDIEFSSEE